MKNPTRNQTKSFFLEYPGAELMIAVFEITGETAIVSAALSWTTLCYKQDMTRAAAREYYAKLTADGWKPVQPDNSPRFTDTHNFIWNIYR